MNPHCCEFDGIQTKQKQAPKSYLLSLTKALFLNRMNQLREQRRLNKQRRIDRDAFRRLIALDDAMLKDIGVKRDDVIWASQLPLSVNASLELEKIAKQPSRNLH